MADTYVSEIPDREQFLKKYGLKDLVSVKNLKEHPVYRRDERSNAGAYFDFKDMQVLNAHISELTAQGRSKKHRHSNEAMIFILAGKGYSILQKEGEPEQRVDWSEGDLMGIPAYHWHQHFNVDPKTPVRYLAVKNVPLVEKLGLFIVEQPKEK